MRTDPRTRYTRQIIKEVFWQLLRQKSMKKITVNEVCTLAQVNRGTFYRHFQDCYDLMAQLEAQALEQLDQTLSNSRKGGLQGMLYSILQKLQNDEEFLAVLARQSRDDAFLHRVVERCFRYMDQRLEAGEGSQGMQPSVICKTPSCLPVQPV